MVKSASAPHSFSCRGAQRGGHRRAHSSVKSIFLPSLLKVAECQNDMLASATASRRTGCAGSWMSSSRPRPAHAPAASPISGYTVMS